MVSIRIRHFISAAGAQEGPESAGLCLQQEQKKAHTEPEDHISAVALVYVRIVVLLAGLTFSESEQS